MEKHSKDLSQLWNVSLGCEQVCIAILDGPANLKHPSLCGANLTVLEVAEIECPNNSAAVSHGTAVASIIFGHHDGPVPGVAPKCRGLLVPIFGCEESGNLRPSSEVELAKALNRALTAGANIINISGGYISNGVPHPLLAEAIARCVDSRCLIVSAAGNSGCDCLHLPAAHESVLAVGAMDDSGDPLAFSNWGTSYQLNGLLAPGKDILTADPTGGVVRQSGTSFATAIVSGVTALLTCTQTLRGDETDPIRVKDLLLESSISCDSQPFDDCRRLLRGRMDIQRTLDRIKKRKGSKMPKNEQISIDQQQPVSIESGVPGNVGNQTVPDSVISPACSCESGENEEDSVQIARDRKLSPSTSLPASSPTPVVEPSACSCGGDAPPRLVYALGQINIDFGPNEARRDSFRSRMDSGKNPENNRDIVEYLKENPWDAQDLIWTLEVDSTAIYALHPMGPYAAQTYDLLRTFLREKVEGISERVSIPGIIAGSTTLWSGQRLDVLVPNHRGMCNWNTQLLIESVAGKRPSDAKARATYDARAEGLQNFLNLVYYKLRNLGEVPKDRALNFAATNAFMIEKVFQDMAKRSLYLESISTESSPLCRPGSTCFDVVLSFFEPENQLSKGKQTHRFTIDVSDVVPVQIGPLRSWHEPSILRVS